MAETSPHGPAAVRAEARAMVAEEEGKTTTTNSPPKDDNRRKSFVTGVQQDTDSDSDRGEIIDDDVPKKTKATAAKSGATTKTTTAAAKTTAKSPSNAGGKKSITTTTGTHSLHNNKNNDDSTSSLPAIVNKKKKPVVQSERSACFEQKVATHQFRDVDDSKPAFKVDRHPHDIKAIGEDDDGAAADNNNQNNKGAKDRRRSLAPQVKVRSHQFRVTEDDRDKYRHRNDDADNNAGRPAFQVERKPTDGPLSHSEFETPEYLAERRKDGPPLHVQVRNHKFRDLDDKPQQHEDQQEQATTPRGTNTKKTTTTAAATGGGAGSTTPRKTPKSTTATATGTTPGGGNNNKGNRSTSTSNTTSGRSPSKNTGNNNNNGPRKIKATVIAEESVLGPGAATSSKATAASSARRDNSSAGGAALTSGVSFSNAAGGGDVDSSFPRQPKCNPDDLDVPVTRILDLLFEKYSKTATAEASVKIVPVAKLEQAFGKLWPGNKLTSELIGDAVETVIDERATAAQQQQQPKTVVASSAEQAAAADPSSVSSALSAEASSSANNAFVPEYIRSAITAVPDGHLSHREFMHVVKVVSTLNNWQSYLAPDTPKVLDLDAFAIVADRLKIDKAAKLFMELTNNGMRNEIPLSRLARHFALTTKRNAFSVALVAAASFKAQKKEAAAHAAQAEQDRQQQAEMEASLPANYFPRQPKCDADDLTLPTSRILRLAFDKYAMTAAEIFPNSEPTAAAAATSTAAPAENVQQQQQDDDGEANNNNTNAASPSPNSNTTSSGSDKFFPLSKMHKSLDKVWPGHALTHDLIDDAIDAVIEDRGNAEKSSNNNEQQQQQLPNKDHVNLKEFSRIFRTIANLNNWKAIIPAETPKLLDLEAFALAADKLKIEKPAKLFMELTHNGRSEAVPQAVLALHFALKKKTLRFSEKQRNNAAAASSNNNDAAAGAAGGAADEEDEESQGLQSGRPSFTEGSSTTTGNAVVAAAQ